MEPNEEKDDIVMDKEIDANELARLIIKHQDDLKETIGDVKLIAHFVRKVKNKDNQFNNFFKLFSDKEYVIVGVVVIAIVAMFLIPDPVNIIMSVISGLLGLGTGRMIGNKDE